MTYSEDLRKRVVAFVQSGGSKSEAALRFNVSRWCVYDWMKRKSLAPKKAGPKAPWRMKLSELQAVLAQHPDAYQDELAIELGVSRGCIAYGLRRLGYSRKKNDTVPSAR